MFWGLKFNLFVYGLPISARICLCLSNKVSHGENSEVGGGGGGGTRDAFEGG